MEWSFIVAAVRRHIGIVAACAIVGALPGLFSIATSDPAYESTATVSVAAPTIGAGAATAAYQPDRYVVSQLSVVTSRSLLESAAESLGGDWSPEGVGSLLEVEQEPEADIIRIKATAGDAKVAAEVANAVATTYIDDATERLVAARQPEIDSLNAKLDALSTQLAEVNAEIVARMEDEIAAARASSNGVLPSENVVVPNQIQQRDALASEYSRVLSARSDIELGVSNQAPNVLIEQAVPASSPKPTLGRLLFVGGIVFGALVGTAIALVLAQLSSKVLDEANAAAVLGVPIVGSMPKARALGDSPTAALERVVPEVRETIERVSVRAEAMASPDIDDALTIAVVGTQAGAGTTTLVLSLARRFAKAGYQVVVVDGDLRTQTISDYFNVDRRSGISAVLRAATSSSTKRQQFFTETTQSNVSVLGVGNIDRRAALRRDALGPILDAARERGQIVIYDGGAMTSSALSLFTTKSADVVVLAVPLAGQDQHELREVANLLPDDRSRVLVVTTSPTKRRGPKADAGTDDDTPSTSTSRRESSSQEATVS